MHSLDGKVAIVTGSSSGIGKATAILFAAEGIKVILADIDQKNSEKTLEEIKNNGRSAFYIKTDVSNQIEVKRLVEFAISHYPKVDILFNGAGIHTALTVDETDLETWQRIIAVNLTSVFLCSKAVLPYMIKQKNGNIVNVSSSIGWQGAEPKTAAYCASKGGVTLLTKAMALDYAKYNIRVNCICPGPTETPMLLNAMDREDLKKFVAQMPLGRTAKPEEIARAALFLVSDDSSYVTGVALPVDGGQTAIA